MKPYTDLETTDKYIIREFNENIDPIELMWHRDDEDRLVEIIGKTDWQIQLDNCLPSSMEGRIFIPKHEWHRVIKGTGTLKLKIEKNINHQLNEGRYDSEVLVQSRYILNKFKENLGQKYTERIKSKILGFNYNLYINIAPSTVGRLGPNPFIVTGQAIEPNTIKVNIRYIPSDFPSELNNLNAEIKGTLRHEIEHISQYNIDKGIEDEEDQDIPLYDYFLLPSEIPAYVNELYKIAKTKKISLTQAIDDFFIKYEYELTKDEIEKIKQAWATWAKNNLPKAQLKESKTIKKSELKQLIKEEIKLLLKKL